MYMVRGAITHWLGIYGRLDEAIANGRATLADYPDNTPNTGALVQAYIWLGLIDEAKSLVESSRAAFPDDESIKKAEINVMLSTGDRDAFIELADREFHALDLNVGDPLDFRSRARAYYYAWASLMQGEYQRAADYFFWVAGGEGGIASKTYDDMYMLKMLALSYRKLDRIEESDALLDRCLDLVAGARDRGWATPTLFVRLAEIHAIRGDVENAVSNLEIALEKGWRDLNMIEYGVFWQGLQDNPEINRIKVRILNDLEDQKLRLENSMRASLRATPGEPNARVSQSVFF
jgi:tetratricopeptide (TPR) repeat protein